MLLRVAAAALALLAVAAPTTAALRINGSTTVHPVIDEAAEILRRESGAKIVVDTAGGSSGGIAALADGRAEVAMVSRPIRPADRERFPATDFHSTIIGSDALALVVSADVWHGGVRCLGREQARRLYEGEIDRWSSLGGPDRRVAFFNKEPGRGTWEVFAAWLYGDAAAAPLVSHPEVGSNEEARSKVASTRGAITQLSAAWADGERTFALGICEPGGLTVRPTSAAVLGGDYPMARPLMVVTDGAPDGVARRLIDLVLSARGQRMVERHGYLPVSAVGGEGSNP